MKIVIVITFGNTIMPFQAFQSPHTEQTVATMKKRIRKLNPENICRLDDDLPDILDFDEAISQPPELFISRVMNPNKRTLLHNCIENFLNAEWNYLRRKMDDFFIDAVDPYLKSFNICSVNRQDFPSNLDKYNLSLYQQVQIVIPKEAEEAFNCLFADRALMRDFSLATTKIIHKKELDMQRCRRWPSWLRDALLHRENGRCALCACDLTHLISIDKKPQIDHIIPISNGGSNDPTNLQLICGGCNRKKSNKNDQTSETRHVFW